MPEHSEPCAGAVTALNETVYSCPFDDCFTKIEQSQMHEIWWYYNDACESFVLSIILSYTYTYIY